MSATRTGPLSLLVPTLAAAVFAVTGTNPASAADAPVSSDPVYSALTTEGETVSGRIRAFSEGGVTLVPADGPERVIPPGKLVKLTRATANVSLTPESPVVIFPGGDRLHRATFGAATETALEVQSFVLGSLPLQIPLDNPLGLVMPMPTDTSPDTVEAVILRVREEPRKAEVLWLANGDRLAGGYLGLTEKAVEFQQGKASMKVDRSGVLAIGFDPALVSYPAPRDAFFELTFSDGSRLGVTGLSVEGGQVSATTRFGAAIKVPLVDVVRAHARTPSIVYLTERETAAERNVPYIGPPRPARRDASVEGQALRLSGQEYDRGFGTQSRSLLAFRLKPGDRRFQALVGVDDRAGQLGNVVFRVLVDDNRELFASSPMSARDAPRPIDLDVSSAKVLILVTEFGERGAVRDLADWVEARIVR